ncbi:FecR family protein [Hyphomonas sp. CACIAM 19H1]|uniref:FecR family protein n=1 Tax=Hyphomonas sp. CACIAM 19H1 TaxID=1873716 RepID=UPI0013B069C7|nr:FecR domain-containing protein [Hyphomonas sp. CACIAM 19H1]
MTGKTERTARLTAAAGWYAELQDQAVTPDVWQRFLIWERDPANAAAFRQVEAGLDALDRTRFTRPARAVPARRVAIWTGALAAAAALVAGLVVVRQPDRETPGQIAPAVEMYATAVGERREVSLADGSVVTLNTASRLEVTYSGGARAVTLLEGQAIFEVAPGQVPFVARAGESLTTALGTEFDIWLRPEGAAITLIEGAVKVSRAGDARTDRLAPGQKLEFRGGEVLITDVDVAEAAGWKTGMIRFRDVPLAEAIEEMNRYSETRLSVPDTDLASARFSGVFPAGNQEVFLESVLLHFEARSERSGSVITVHPGADKRRQETP